MKTGKAIVAKQIMKENANVPELIIREGDAPVIHEPKIINLSGTLDAPRKFLEKRKSLHQADAVHVLFSRIGMKIRLVVDEKDHFGGSVEGSLQYNPEYLEFGINNPKKLYTIKDLQQFLKLRKYFFADKDANLTIVTSLGKFKANVASEIEQNQDSRGNKKDSYEVKVATEFVLDFVLSIPIYKGQPANKIKVEVGFDVRDSEITVWLESAECKELELQLRDKLIDEEIKQFTDYVVIEQ